MQEAEGATALAVRKRPCGRDDEVPTHRMRTKGPLVSKRPRDIAQDEILAEEESLARGAARDARDVMLITVTGPPWFDT
eukprot:6665624-Heterocapsa_arctica.AAC.1